MDENITTQPPVVEEQAVEIVPESSDHDTIGQYVGICKWFNNVYGFGFITIWDGEDKGKDIFVHHTGIRPANSQYKTLKKGEYLSFDIQQGDKGQQAYNVRGINGGPLLCDQVQVRKHMAPMPHMGVPPMPADGRSPTSWNTISYRKRHPSRPRTGSQPVNAMTPNTNGGRRTMPSMPASVVVQAS